MSDIYNKEMEKLERQQKELRDNYNTLDAPYNLDDYEAILKADLDFTPKKGQTWKSYAEQIAIYVKINAKKSIKIHITNPKRPWYTHRSGNCFMCEDMNLIKVFHDTINLMAKTSPDNRF